jgi:hypothetical protein
MVARNLCPPLSASNAVTWRRWEAGSLRAFAQVGTIRWPNVNDLRGRPLPPVPQLTAIISGLSCYHSLHASCRELSDAVRRAVLDEVAEGVHEAVAALRRDGLDLYWRIEGQDPDEGGTAPPENSLGARPRPAGLKRQASLWRRIAREWWDEIETSFLRGSQHWSEGFTAVAASPLLRQATPAVGTEPPAAAEPTRIVVAAIGDASSSGGEDVAEAYQALAKPLPLRGSETDPEQLRRALLAEFPHLRDAIDRIIGDLRLRRRAGVNWVRFRPLLLVGPPGVGKTWFAKRLARLLDLGYGEVSGAGSSDDRMLRGTARGWRGAQPAFPLLVMLRTGGANPLIVVDEVDKAGGSERNGDIRQTLLPMLEVETARAWFDEALLAPTDLSGVSWLLTANDLAPLSAPLLSRVAVVQAPAGARA